MKERLRGCKGEVSRRNWLKMAAAGAAAVGADSSAVSGDAGPAMKYRRLGRTNLKISV